MKIPKASRAIVTGAGSGFGRAVSLELATRGGRILVSDLDLDSAQETAELIRSRGGIADSMRADVREAGHVKELVDRAVTEWDGLDVIVNNAGVAVAGAVGDISLDDWKFEIDVNLMGVVHGCHFAIPVMKQAKRGWILNVASAAGLLSAPLMGPYNVTKAGVIALSETLCAELRASNIAVSALCPTFFRTNIHRAQRSNEKMRKVTAGLIEKSKWSAEEIARIAVNGLENDTLYVIPQLDGKMLWRAKRALGGAFYSFMGRATARGVALATRSPAKS